MVYVFYVFSDTNQNLPTDISYVDVSEISVSDNSEVAWNLDSYTKTPRKSPRKTPRKTPKKPTSIHRTLTASTIEQPPKSLQMDEPQVDIIDESNNPSTDWNNKKGAKNILNSYFQQYIEEANAEKLWNSSPLKAPQTPQKRQEETESLTSIAEDKFVTDEKVISPKRETEESVAGPTGPLHSTPMISRKGKGPRLNVSPLRRSPRKGIKMAESMDEEEEAETEVFLKPVEQLDKSDEEKTAAEAQYKSPPQPRRKVTPKSSLRALSMTRGSSVMKQVPAEMVLNTSKGADSDASSVASSKSSKRLLTSKSNNRGSYKFDYMASGNARKQPTQKDFDKIVEEYHQKKNTSLDKSNSEISPTENITSQKRTMDSSALNSDKLFTQSDLKSPEVNVSATGNSSLGFSSSNLRLSLTMMRSSKKGCLCHEHTEDSPCPLRHTPKKNEVPRLEGISEEEPASPKTSNKVTVNKTPQKSINEDSREARRRRGDMVRKRLHSEPLPEKSDHNASGDDKPKPQKRAKVDTEPSSSPVKRTTRQQIAKESPNKNPSTITKDARTRKSKRKNSQSPIPPAKRKRGIAQYDFSSGLDNQE